jgi:hypothetical protein
VNVEPCPCCERTERDRRGRCVRCKAEIDAILAERVRALPPCNVCGDHDYSPAGRCRPCNARRQREFKERERSPEVVERKRALLELATAYLKRQGIDP